MQLLKSGGLSLHGVFIALAVISMILYAIYYTSKNRYDNNALMYIIPPSIFFGFFGARLMYVTVCDQLYVEAADKWRLTDGGYALFGAAAGVILTVIAFWLITGRRIKLLTLLDTVCAAAPLGIAMGRLGSIFSQDCLGEAVESERLNFFPVAIFNDFDQSYHLAVFFYESVACVILFFIIMNAEKRTKRAGTASFLFAVVYCGVRAAFESMRTDSMYIGFVRINQVLAILTVIGVFVYVSVRLCRVTGFKPAYLIPYAIFTASFVTAFFSEFYMYSGSKVLNTVKIIICCLIMMATAIYTGALYVNRTKKKPEKKKRLPDKTQTFKKAEIADKAK